VSRGIGVAWQVACFAADATFVEQGEIKIAVSLLNELGSATGARTRAWSDALASRRPHL
jgi:hypothetical protein